MPDLPPNVQEFNTVAGLIFAQLYRSFPAYREIDKQAIAGAMDVMGPWAEHKLPSGRSFDDMLRSTILWLHDAGFIIASGASNQRMDFTEKGLAAMNAMPETLKQPLGSELAQAAERGGGELWRIGDLIGGIFGGYTKSVGGG
jgi:hypothetical protein